MKHLFLGILCVVFLTACNESHRVAYVRLDKIDTTYLIYDRNGKACKTKNYVPVVNDTLRCYWIDPRNPSY